MKRNLILLSVYAVGMAYVEAAVVVYLRKLYYPDDPVNIFPLQFLTVIDWAVELGREAATVVMILSVAWLAERGSASRAFAAFLYVFGVWDLCYYAWLKVLIGWPLSWLDWDVLFLIPSVWLGPWICPALVSVLFIVWGGWVLRSSESLGFTWGSLAVFLSGAALGVAAFLQPAGAVLMETGIEGMQDYTPTRFGWWLFLPGYLLMAWGLGRMLLARAAASGRQLA